MQNNIHSIKLYGVIMRRFPFSYLHFCVLFFNLKHQVSDKSFEINKMNGIKIKPLETYGFEIFVNQ